MLRALWILSLLLSLTDAMVTMEYSLLLDEFDFLNTTNLPLELCEKGCVIYAAALDTHRGGEENLVIKEERADGARALYSIADLATTYIGNNGNRWGLQLAPGNYSIENTHPEMFGAPVAVYVVALVIEDNYVPSRQVFDPWKLALGRAHEQRITFLSMEPYTILYAEAKVGPLRIYTAGYDVLERENGTDCFPVVEATNHSRLILPLHTPLVTVDFGAPQEVSLVLLAGINTVPYNVTLGTQAAVLSPGHVGCGGYQRFRYAHRTPVNVYFGADAHLGWYISADLSVAQDDPVELTPFNGVKTELAGDEESRFQSTLINSVSLMVTWADNHDNGTFAIRINAEEPGEITSTSTTRSTTPGETTTPPSTGSTTPGETPTGTGSPVQTTTTDDAASLVSLFSSILVFLAAFVY